MENEENIELDPISEFLGSEEGLDDDNNMIMMENQELIIHNPNVRSNVEEDYKDSRKSMKTAIASATNILKEISKVAKESESPRAYEVLANTLKTVTEMNKALMDLHKDAKELMEQKEPQQIHNHNTFFNGTTDELQRFIRDKSESER